MNVTNNSSNSAVELCVFPLAYRITVSALLASTLLISPILNFIVCYTLLTVKKLYTFGNFLIASLSFGDILISLSLSLMEILYVSIYPKWLTGKIGTYMLNAVWLFSLASPFVTVTVITCERYKTIRSLVPITSNKVIKLVISLIWIYNFTVVGVMVFFFTEPSGDYYEWNILPVYYYSFLAIHVVIPLVVIAILYMGIYCTMRSSRRRASVDNASATSLARREMRLAKTIGIVTGVMFAIWIPALVFEYFYAVGTESCVVQMAGPVNVWLSCSNAGINPLIYFYKNPVLRAEIVKKLPEAVASCLRLKKTQTASSANTNATPITTSHCNQAFKHSSNSITTLSASEINTLAAFHSSISDTKSFKFQSSVRMQEQMMPSIQDVVGLALHSDAETRTWKLENTASFNKKGGTKAGPDAVEHCSFGCMDKEMRLKGDFIGLPLFTVDQKNLKTSLAQLN
eukprot:gene20532-22551_t